MTKWAEGVQAIEDARERYTPERLAYYERMAQEVFAFLKLEGRVLDVGCGSGLDPRWLGPMVTGYVGVDVSIRHPRPGLDLRIANAEALPFEDGSFDTVLSHSVWQHLENPEIAIAEAARVLVSGGRLAVNVSVADPNPIFMHRYDTEDVVFALVRSSFELEGLRMLEKRILLMNLRKRA